jgi:lysophospholipase L1-like esterase
MNINIPTYTGTIGNLTVNGQLIKDNVTTSGVYFPTNWGVNWKSKLSNTATSNATIAILGDSITYGFDASDLTTRTSGNSYSGVLRNSLQSLYGDGGSGYISVNMGLGFGTIGSYTSANTGVSTTGTWTTQSGDGPASANIYTNTLNSTATFAYVRGSTIVVYFSYAPNVGTFTVTIDGTNMGTVTATSGSFSIGTSSYTVSAGTHTVLITSTSSGASGYVSLFGVRGTNPTGVIVDNYGYSGQTSGGVLTGNNGSFGYGGVVPYSGGNSMRCDLFIYALGVNDARALSGYATTADIYGSNVSTTFEYIRNNPAFTSTGSTDIMIMMPHIGTSQSTGPNYYLLMERAMSMASSYGGAFVSMGTIYKNSYNNFYTMNGFVLHIWT